MGKEIKKKGQISTEYIIVISFVMFAVLSVLGIAFFYSAQIRDAIKFHQIESFSQKVISLSESVYYSGEPSQATTTAYLPEGVVSVEVMADALVFNVSTSGGYSYVAFPSNVALEGTISSNSGVKRLILVAGENGVGISQA